MCRPERKVKQYTVDVYVKGKELAELLIECRCEKYRPADAGRHRLLAVCVNAMIQLQGNIYLYILQKMEIDILKLCL